MMNNPKIEIVTCSSNTCNISCGSSSSSISSNCNSIGNHSGDGNISNLNEINISLKDKETTKEHDDLKEATSVVDRNNNSGEDLSKMLNSLNITSTTQEASN